MATNDFEIQVDTDDYDLFGAQGHTTPLPGTPTVDPSGHLIIPSDPFFSPSTLKNSTMDKDPNNTGPTTSFWEYYPLSIDVDGYIFYYNENTGINVRGPEATVQIAWDDLTPEQRASLKGQDGANGLNGQNGRDGANGSDGYDAYQLWLIDNGWQDHPEQHPHSDFYAYLANLSNAIIQEGTGNGSLLLNYRGQAGSVASGAGASAFGNHTTASGANSIATGNNTIAGYQNQFVIGKYNQNKSNSLFEIGNGLNNSSRANVLEINTYGNLTVSGEITDGFNNVLSNKLDITPGKQLSTYDFDAAYKDILDNYHVDTDLNSSSDNPISNSAVYTAIENVRLDANKPDQYIVNNDQDYYFFHPTPAQEGTLEQAGYTTNLTWNPYKKTLKTTNAGITHTDVLGFGSNLISAANGQILFGKYNLSDEGDILQIGGGYSNEARSNLLSLNANGDLTTFGDIIDGDGNTLSDKQEKLIFDETLIKNSQNMVTSGVIYDYLISHGIDPVEGINIPEIDVLEGLVSSLSSAVTRLQAQVTAIGNPYEIEDEAHPGRFYTYGIYDDEFYIKRKTEPDPPEPEPDPEKQEEEGE